MPGLMLSACLLCGPGVADSPSKYPITLISLTERGPPPEKLTRFYSGIYEDSKITGDPEPVFFTSNVDMNGDGKKETFVRVESPLACSARGCEIDVFAEPAGDPKKIFSVVADTIGYAQVPRPPSADVYYPPLVTDFTPPNTPPKIPNVSDDHLASSGAGQIWNWNGKAYVPEK
jgi:hypothetical protein